MVKQTRHIISESEKDRIRNLYFHKKEKRNYIFESCISVDQKYFILHDTVFDIQEQRSLGNIWESIDTFKTLFNTIKVNDSTGEYQTIIESLNKLPLLENHINLHNIKNLLIEWNFFDDTWLGTHLKDSGTSMSNAFKEGFDQLKKLGVSISQGEWNEILNLLGKGVIWTFRKLKSAMYSTLGMIADAILVATGIGKTVQWIPWALITGLDIYQFLNNDWPEDEREDPTWLKLLFIGFDVLGLVSTGAMAKIAREEFKVLNSVAKDPKKVTQIIKTNPKLKTIINSIISGLKKVPSFMGSAIKHIGKKFPAGASFLSGIVNKMSGVLSSIENTLSKLIGERATKGVISGTNTGGALYGFEKGVDKYTQWKTGLSPVQIKNLETLDGLQKKYGNKDPFEF